MNALLGIGLTRRDDIESLAYVLIYLVRKSLPWQNIGENSEILDMRMSIAPSILCEGLPAEFEVFLNYAQSLDFKQKPDYQYLRDLFRKLSNKLDNDDDTDINQCRLLKEYCPETQKTPASNTPKMRVRKCQDSEPLITRK
jgi:hypothetical protein